MNIDYTISRYKTYIIIFIYKVAEKKSQRILLLDKSSIYKP